MSFWLIPCFLIAGMQSFAVNCHAFRYILGLGGLQVEARGISFLLWRFARHATSQKLRTGKSLRLSEKNKCGLNALIAVQQVVRCALHFELDEYVSAQLIGSPAINQRY